MYSSEHIAKLIEGELKGDGDLAISHLITDSRTISFYPECAFFALVSGRNNGHKFINGLYESGVRCFIVSETIAMPGKDACVIKVGDTLKALQQLAAYHRSQYNIPVLGVTGSNGKTIVKEWLYQLLKNKFSICRSPKSYNSQIGVPLSVWNLNIQHTLAIFEAGISTTDEMQKLEQIIQPRIGIFTGIGEAHSEGFKNLQEKVREKFRLFENCETIVVQGLKRNEIPEITVSKKLILVSEESDADLVIQKTSINHGRSSIQLSAKGKNYSVEIPFTDKASIINSATCFATLMATGLDPSEFIEQFKELQPIALRLEIKNGINNSILINDFYNSDLDSLQIALNYLNQQSRNTTRTVILSDIEQSGQSGKELYEKVALLLHQYQIYKFIGVGKKISAYKDLFPAGSEFFESTNDLILNMPQLENTSILLKGARSFGFEKISQLLQQKSHDTVLEINLNKLVENINFYRGYLNPGTRVMCMVKAMGYGSGGPEIAKTLQHIGVNYLAVAYADEGVELRNANINLPVMVMSPEPDSLEDIIQFRLEPEIYSFRILEAFCRQLDKMGISEPFPIHLKIDTGMHRLGFEEKDWAELAEVLLKSPQVKVQSVFSHLVATDNPELDEFTTQQIELFKNAFTLFEEKLGYSFLKHICNSGGISRFKEAHFDMVRLGIGMYGVGVNPDEQRQLQNVGALRTRISQIKSVKKGDTVGYNRNGKIEKDTLIATVPIGYADGFRRDLGNGRFGVYINNVFCKTVGNICMDMCMVDVTNINCREGDEAVIFENFEQIRSMAETLKTIPYEVLTGISSRVKRIYVQE